MAIQINSSGPQTARESIEKEIGESDSETPINQPKKITIEPINIVYAQPSVGPSSVKHESSTSGGSFAS